MKQSRVVARLVELDRQLLDQVIGETLSPDLIRVIRATERSMVPDAVREATQRVWTSRQSAVIAARSARLLRFNPTALVLEELVRQGVDLTDDIRAALARRDELREKFRHWIAGGGDQVIVGYRDASDELIPGWPENPVPRGAVVSWHDAANTTTVPACSPAEWGTMLGAPGTWTELAVIGNSGVPAVELGLPGSTWWSWALRQSAGDSVTVPGDGQVVIPEARRFIPRVSWAAAAERNRARPSPWPQARRASYSLPDQAPAQAPDTFFGREIGPAESVGVEFGVDRADNSYARAHDAPDEARSGPQLWERNVSNTPFGRGNREGRKLKLPLWRRILVVRLLERLTEVSDAIGAVYQALPKEVRRAVRQEWVEGEFQAGVKRPARDVPDSVKLAALWKYEPFLDVDGVLRELLWETLEDRLYGIRGRATGRGLANIQRSPSGTVSPNVVTLDGEFRRYDHPLAQKMPLDQLEQLVTRRAERRAEQSRRPDVVEFQRAWLARMAAERQQRTARKILYRQLHGGPLRRPLR